MIRQRGFTLLEVLVAFAILTLALAALYEAMVSSAVRAAVIAHRRPALAIARSLLAEYSVQPNWVARTIEGEEYGFRWSVVITPKGTPYDVDSPRGDTGQDVPVDDVEVTVSWGTSAAGRAERLHVKTVARRLAAVP